MPGLEKGHVDLSPEFRELCMACRKGDVALVDKYISSGINLNQLDEWDYSPLILASICGHEAVVRLLLEKGCLVDRDTFEGTRAIYGALNDSIRQLLTSYDITKAADVTQPFASHITSMLVNPKITTKDSILTLQNGETIGVHRFMLEAMSDYFREHVTQKGYTIDTEPGFNATSWKSLVEYVYLVPQLELKNVDVGDLSRLALHVGLPDLARAAKSITEQKSVTEQFKVRNSIQRQMGGIARSKLERFVQSEIVGRKVVVEKTEEDEEPDEGLSESQKVQMISGGADIILCADLGDTYVFFPVHRAILARAGYFETLFGSSFSDTAVFDDLLLEDLGIIDKRYLPENPEEIPVVSLPTSTDTKMDLRLVEVLLNFLYFDDSEIPIDLSLSTLVLADALFIDRLKTMAAVSVTQIENYDTKGISVYDVLRVAWQTRVQRLEDHVAKIIAMSLPRYLHDPGFKTIVRESADRISEREDNDTIELIADIKFHLHKVYHLANDEGTLNPWFYMPDKDEEYARREALYEEGIAGLDAIVEELGLN